MKTEKKGSISVACGGGASGEVRNGVELEAEGWNVGESSRSFGGGVLEAISSRRWAARSESKEKGCGYPVDMVWF